MLFKSGLATCEHLYYLTHNFVDVIILSIKEPKLDVSDWGNGPNLTFLNLNESNYIDIASVTFKAMSSGFPQS